MTTDKKCLIGLISDTHGYLDSGVLKIFAQTDLIVHAGDIGKPEILDMLKSVAPVNAVRGNMDYGGWASALPLFEVVTFGGIMLYVLHDLQKLDLDPAASGISAVISGHTHLLQRIPHRGKTCHMVETDLCFLTKHLWIYGLIVYRILHGCIGMDPCTMFECIIPSQRIVHRNRYI